MRRRTVVGGAAGVLLLAAGAAARAAGPGDGTTARPHRRLREDPFTLGVASGDPDHTGVVLWTRLAPQPLAADGRGGMPPWPVRVDWVLARDPRLRQVVRRGAAQALPERAHAVHVLVDGLAPDRWYFYRFTADGHASPVGRTRTAPPPGAAGGRLRLAVASCAMYEHGYFTAYRHLAAGRPDVVLHLGDYLYEYGPGEYLLPGGNPRTHVGGPARTLADYRRRYAQYRTDPDLQAAHAAAPWCAVPDDHEVANNWAGDVPQHPDPGFVRRRDAALRAYAENLPLRAAAAAAGPGADLRAYRRLRWGRLATVHLLDTRRHRDDQACGDNFRDCPAAADPARTMLGAAQERWLDDGLRASAAVWDLIGQQVFLARRDRDPGPPLVTNQDCWDGYPAARDRLVRGWAAAGVRNPVVLTGDVHAHWVADVRADAADPDAPVVGTELVCSSVSSGGDGHDLDPAAHPFMPHNPHLRFYNYQRGYLLATLTPASLTADFQVVPWVRTPGAPAYSRARFVVRDRRPGARAAYVRPLDPAPPPTPPSGGPPPQAEGVRAPVWRTRQ
ncbi:MAG TPA: alkaline phosphatase D family protein [Pilimelia sp.]|nr:alkaline phosphatase D family protein [Pilimelia sp.]